MSQRLRLYDVMISRMPSLVGLCQDNLPEIANMVNSAQRRLIYAKEAREEGWYGTWAEIVFLVSQANPYITLPREIARLEALNICETPVRVQNQWYEYMTFGDGRMPKSWPWLGWGGIVTQGFTRNNAITFSDMTNAPQFITVYVADAQDANGIRRTLIQGLDADGNPIYSENVEGQTVTGAFMTFQTPFSTSPMTFTQITGIQKDVTIGQVRFYQHDPITGHEMLLLTMEPGETTASYRRYYFHRLPWSCCAPSCQPFAPPTGCDPAIQLVPVTALAKLDLIPAVVQTDWLLIQNLEAIIEECQSIRLSEIDATSAKQQAAERHKQAIGLLMGEQAHYLGLEKPAVRFSPFGDARLTRAKIGRLI